MNSLRLAPLAVAALFACLVPAEAARPAEGVKLLWTKNGKKSAWLRFARIPNR